MEMYVLRPYPANSDSPSLGSNIVTKKITNSYRFGVALNDFPRQQDPATTNLDDACAQVHHTGDTSMIDDS